jgi:hypothetical protein
LLPEHIISQATNTNHETAIRCDASEAITTKATKQALTTIDNMTKSTEVHIGEYSEGHLLKVAHKMVAKQGEKTRFFDKHAEASVPHYKLSGERDRVLLS